MTTAEDSFLHGNASRWQHWEPQLQALLPEFADWLEPAQAMLNALRDAVTT